MLVWYDELKRQVNCLGGCPRIEAIAREGPFESVFLFN